MSDTVSDIVRAAERSFAMSPVNSTYHDGGIKPSEMRAFLDQARAVDTIIESGRGYHAYSTRVISEWQKQHPLRLAYSIDWEQRWLNMIVSHWRLRKVRNVAVESNDATVRLPALLAELFPQRRTIALLVDGPKSLDAVRMMEPLWRMYPAVRVAALHGYRDGVLEAFQQAHVGARIHIEQNLVMAIR